MRVWERKCLHKQYARKPGDVQSRFTHSIYVIMIKSDGECPGIMLLSRCLNIKGGRGFLQGNFLAL